MIPAGSVLLLTILTGFGYGLIAWLGLFGAWDALPRGPYFAPAAMVIGLGCSTAGLLASLLHLGHPKRAWRAFSQWRSSWLSREGVAAVATVPPALAFVCGWWLLGGDAVTTRVLGGLAGALGMLTVFCTAMIYASLKPIRQWRNAHTAPDYLIFAVYSGAVLLTALWAVWFGSAAAPAIIAVFMAFAAGGAKLAYWRCIDAQSPLATLASATGLAALGPVRPLDQPHFTENYVLREMGFQVARKHALKLRRIAAVLAFGLPAVLCLLVAYGLLAAVAATFAMLSTATGIFVERWLFFAEATHVSTLYYGR